MNDQLPLHVLIIEDDVDTCDNLQDILELDDHVVTFANTAAEALTHPRLGEVSVILLDWKLPDATALEILPRLSASAAEAEIVIITGHGDFDRAVAALREGAADYLLKPVNPEALRSRLRKLASRRWLAQEKARTDEMLRNLVQAAPCLIVIVRRDLSIVYFSAFAERITGYSADELIGKNFRDIFMPETPLEEVRQSAESVFKNKSLWGHETVIRHREGPMIWMVWNAQLLDDVDGEPAILAVGQDVTQQKLATEKLVQAERLAAIGEAMTGLAHESRNALQRSQASLELLSAMLEDRPEAIALVGRIQKAQTDLHQLYEEVREYAAPLKISPQPCSIEELLNETWACLEHLHAGRDIHLCRETDVPSCVCRVDRFAMRQVFRNILENSLSACTDPVQITVNCSLDEQADGDWIEIAIRDNGPGFNHEQKQRLFDPFYTTKTKGTGLGMTLCKRILDAHGGRIAVGEGPGAEILLSLPSAERGDRPASG
jgi:two-component system, LuxR family, sensor kinase FixL